jgi:hypothetical protein
MWNFASMRTLAIRQLSSLTTPVDRVVLGRKYGIEHWLGPAYRAICERDEWLSKEEGARLGLEDVLKIGHARQMMRPWATLEDVRFPCEVFAISTSGSAGSGLPSASDVSSHEPAVIPFRASPQDIGRSDSAGSSGQTVTTFPGGSGNEIVVSPYTVYAPITDSVRQQLASALAAVVPAEHKVACADKALGVAKCQRAAAVEQHRNLEFREIRLKTVSEDEAYRKARDAVTQASAAVKSAYGTVLTTVCADLPQSALSYCIPVADITSALAALSAAERLHIKAAQIAARAHKHAECSRAWQELCARIHSKLPTDENAMSLAEARRQWDAALSKAKVKDEEQQDTKDKLAGAHLALATMLSKLLAAAVAHGETTAKAG